MKKTITFFILVVFFLQYSMFSMITAFEEFNSSVMLCFLLALFLRRGYLENLTWALFVGFLMDYFSSVPLGFHVIIFAILAFSIDLLRRIIALKEMHFSIVAIVVFFGVIIFDLVAFLFSSALVSVKLIEEAITFDFSVSYVFTKILLAILGFVFYRFFLLVEKIFGIGAMDIKIDKV